MKKDLSRTKEFTCFIDKLILMTILLCFLFCLPTTTYAKTYNLNDTDMCISVDDSIWYVFTRDNIKNNSELDGLGIAYDTMHDILYNNEAYMNAILYYENGEYTELFIRKRSLDTGIANLSNYKNTEVLEIAKELAKKQGADTYSVYENQYKFAKLEYIDSNLGYYICEFVTCVNKDNYTFTFQSTSQFTNEEYAEIESIVDSIKFDVDTSIKEKKSIFVAEDVVKKAIASAVIGCAIGAVIAIINKKRKKRSETDNAPVADNAEITIQGNFEYNFSYDASQKLLFLLTVWILFGIPWGDYRFAIFIFCCIVGRTMVMPVLQFIVEMLQGLLSAKERKRPFLFIPRPLWTIVVLIILTYILIDEIIGGDFFAIPAALIMYFAGFFVFAGFTTLSVTEGSDDPNKIGSPEWKKANEVEQVGFDLMNPLWRDKNGNYYRGTQYVPTPPPVNITNKDK